MRNRAKCKLCDSVIESYHSEDYVTCKCDEISVYGGNAMRCAAKDFANFMRVDDEGNEIVVTLHDTKEVAPFEVSDKPNKKELIDMLGAFIKSIEGLPSHALHEPVNHHDLMTALILIKNIFLAKGRI